MLLEDINSGPTDSFPQNLRNANGALYFQAIDGIHGAEIWKSDGTGVGTVMVKDVNTGASGSSPGAVTKVNGTLYFLANDSAHGSEL